MILTGIDGSRTSMRAGAYAGGLARRQGALLVAVYVNSTGAIGGMTGLSAGAAVAAMAASRDFGEQLRDEAVATAAQARHPAAVHDHRGRPRTASSPASPTRYGPRPSSSAPPRPTGHRLVGSLAVRLVKAGRWPVTVVP